jgi:hypothetical protein
MEFKKRFKRFLNHRSASRSNPVNPSHPVIRSKKILWSSRREIGLKLVVELQKDVSRELAAIVCRASNIIDGRDFLDGHVARGLHGFLREGLTDEILFGSARSYYHWPDAAECDARRFNCIVTANPHTDGPGKARDVEVPSTGNLVEL